MPGEFINFNNPGFPAFGYPPQNIIQFDRPLFESHPHHRGHHRRAHSNFSDDESIHLVPVRPARKHKHAHAHAHAHGKENGHSNEASKQQQQQQQQNADAANAAAAAAANGHGTGGSTVAGGSTFNTNDKKTRSSSTRKDSEKVESSIAGKQEEAKKEQSKTKKDKESKDSKVKRSSSESSKKAKSKERKHKHKKQPVLVEEFFIPGSHGGHGPFQTSFGGSAGFQQAPAGFPQRNIEPAGFAPRYQQYSIQEQFVPQFQQYGPEPGIIPGSPVFSGTQYGSIGEPIPLGSIPIGPDAIVEPIVTIGPRTDIGAFGEFNPSANSIQQQQQVFMQPPQQPVFTGASYVEQPLQPLQPFYGGLPPCPPYITQQQFIPQPPPQPIPRPVPVGPTYTGVYEESLVLPYPAQYPVEQQQQQQTIVVDSGYNHDLPPGSRIVAEYVLGFLDDYDKQGQDTVVEIWEEKTKKKEKKKDKKEKEVVKPTPDPLIRPGVVPGTEPVPTPKPPVSPLPVPVVPSKPPSSETTANDLNAFKKEILDALNQLKLGDGGGKTGDNVVQPIFLMPKQAEQAPQKPVYIPRNIYVPVIRPVFVPRERIIVRPQIIHVARPVLVDRPVPVQQRPIVIERDRPIPIRVETVEKIENIETTHSQVSPKKEVISYETYYDDYEKRLIKADEDDHKYDAYYDHAAAAGTSATNQSSTYQYTTSTDYSKLYQDQAATSSYQYTTSVDDYERRLREADQRNAYTTNVVDYEKILNEANRSDARSGTNLAGSSQYETKLYNASRQDLIGGSSSTGGVAYSYEDIYTDESRKKQELQQLVNEVEKKKWDIQQTKPTSSASYTLEVLDPTVSNKFERVDQSNLKSIYGIDTYQYIPPAETTATQGYASQTYSSQAYPGEYISTFQPSDSSFRKTESYRTLSHQEAKSTNSYSNLTGAVSSGAVGISGSGSGNAGYGAEATPVGTITNVAQLPGQGLTNLGQAPVVIQNVQKMIQNFGTSFTPETIVTSSNPSNN